MLRSPISRVPGPWFSKWTDLVLTYHWLKGTRCQYVHSLHRRYGESHPRRPPVSLSLSPKACLEAHDAPSTGLSGPIVRLAPNEVEVSDVDAVKAIYTTKETFRKADWYKNFTTIGVETIFNTSDPVFYKRHRRFLAGPMSESSLRVFHGRIQARTDLAMARMRDEMRARGAADVLKWWYFMAADIIGDLTFGEPFQMLKRGRVRGASARAVPRPLLTAGACRRTSSPGTWTRSCSWAPSARPSRS